RVDGARLRRTSPARRHLSPPRASRTHVATHGACKRAVPQVFRAAQHELAEPRTVFWSRRATYATHSGRLRPGALRVQAWRRSLLRVAEKHRGLWRPA